MLIRTHPITGLPLEPLGYVRGRPVWPIMGGSEATPETPAPTAPSTPVETSAPVDPKTAEDDGDDLAKLDGGALAKMVRDLRTENKRDRTAGKEAAAKAADEAARKAVVADIAKALGLDGGDKLTPEQLQAKLSEAQEGTTKATQAATAAARELAVYRVAAKAGGDPDALLDSRSFLDSINGLDPAADGFRDKVTAAVQKAVKDNPSRLALAATGKGGADIRGGSGETQGKPKDLAEAIQRRLSTGN
jgi:hypothetical protein